MLPAMIDRFQPALSVMQSITTLQARLQRDEARGTLAGQDAAAPATTQAKDMEAVNDYYFGNHLTVTEAMTRLFERLVGYLNEKLALGRDGSEAAAAAGDEWRANALREDVAINSDEDFSIPKPGEDGFSFRRVAQMIQSAFDTDFLSRDQELKKLLEEMIGFRLDGMTVADLLEAFTDPTGKAAEKVRGVLSEGLAGQAGSKASQRLERAASGPKSVEETVADAQDSSIHEVDEETLAENLEVINSARARERLEEAAKLPGEIAQALEEAEPTGAGAAQRGTKIAMAVIQALGSLGETGAKRDEIRGETANGDAVAAAADIPESRGTIEQEATAGYGERPELTSIVQAYLEMLEPEDEQEERFSMVL